MSTPINWLSRLSNQLQECDAKIGDKPASCEAALEPIQSSLRTVRENNGTFYWIDNGGSLGACSHLSQDLLNKLKLRSTVLNDPALLTCISNDFGYENVFQRPLSTLMKPNDGLIAISSSGNSENILSAVKWCNEKSMTTITLSAFSPTNKLFALPSTVALFLPTELYGIAEVGHTALLHAAIETMWQTENNS